MVNINSSPDLAAPSLRLPQLVVVLAALLILATPGRVFSAQSSNLEPVVLQLNGTHQFQFAGYYAAQARGFYRQAGLAVTLQEGKPGFNPVEAVVSGNAQFGVSNSDLILRRIYGEPVVLLAAILQQSPSILISLRQSQIYTPTDLAGRPVMVADPRDAELNAMLKAAGVSMEALRVVRPETATAGSDELKSGRIAALYGSITHLPYELEAQGIDYNLIRPRTFDIDFYGDLLFTSEQLIQKSPGIVAAFRKATLAGWHYALTHPEEMIDLMLERYPPRHTQERAHLEQEAAATIKLMMPNIIAPGHINEQRVGVIARQFMALGLATSQWRLNGFIYDDHQPTFNWNHWSLKLGLFVIGAISASLVVLSLVHRRLRLAYQKAGETNRIKSQFLATVSHEIRTPLHGILGMTKLLLNSPLTPQQREFVQDLQLSGNNLLQLINDVLNLTRIEKGRWDLEYSEFNLRDALEQLIDEFAETARQKQLELLLLMPASASRQLRGDLPKLRHILENLLGNALKFTEQGHVHLIVNLSAVDKDRYRLHVEVQDTGIGIPETYLAHIFEPFTQADSSTARSYEGTGLGMTITKQLLDMLGGHISVKSQPGKGSRFIFELTMPSAKGQRTAEPLAGKRVLIIDDRPARSLALSQQVEALQGLAETCLDSDTAYQAVQASAEGTCYDLVMMSAAMPDVGEDALLSLLLQETAALPTKLLILADKPSLVTSPYEKPGKVAKLVLPSKTNSLRQLLMQLDRPAPQAIAVSRQEQPPLHAQLLARRRVLVVEDNVINAKLAKHSLQHWGCTVSLAADAGQALSALNQHRFDLILMDCQLPGMDGYTLTGEIRRQGGANAQAPIIALTASVFGDVRTRCLEAGMNDFLSKPLSDDDLLHTLERWLPSYSEDSVPAPITGPGAAASVLAGQSGAHPESRSDTTLAQELWRDFLQELPAQLESLRRLAQSDQPEALALEAHHLKGSCMVLEVQQMTDLCQALERHAHRPQKRSELISRLEGCYEQLKSG